MKIKMCMIFEDVIRKRLDRKKVELKEIEDIMEIGTPTSAEKRKFVELKAVVNELENCLDMAETMFKFQESAGKSEEKN